MNAVVIDTSTWIELLARGATPLQADALVRGLVHVPPLVAAEVLSGKLGAARRRELEGSFLELPWCGADEEHWFRVGRLRSSLREKGLTVSTPDAHVAQCALDLGAELWSEDHVFRHVARHTKLRLGEPGGRA